MSIFHSCFPRRTILKASMSLNPKLPSCLGILRWSQAFQCIPLEFRFVSFFHQKSAIIRCSGCWQTCSGKLEAWHSVGRNCHSQCFKQDFFSTWGEEVSLPAWYLFCWSLSFKYPRVATLDAPKDSGSPKWKPSWLIHVLFLISSLPKVNNWFLIVDPLARS